MKRSSLNILAGLGLAAQALLPSTAWAAPDLASVQACVHNNVPQRTIVQKVMMRHTDPAGEQRLIVAKLHLKRNANGMRSIMMKVEHPSDLSGARYLLLEGKSNDDVYMYLPAYRKVRQIRGSAVAGQLFGTNLNYQDIKQIYGSFNQLYAEEITDSTVDGRPTFRVRMTADDSTESNYGLVVTNIDRDTCLPLKVDLYDVSQRHIKTVQLNPEKISRVDGRMVGHEYRVKNVGNTEVTELYLGDVYYDKKIDENVFHPEAFHTTR